MDVLMLCYRGEALREFALRATPLEIGRGAGCDIVVHDPEVRDRHLLVTPVGGAVMVYELGEGSSRRAKPLGTGEEIRLGRHHSLARLPMVPTRPIAVHATEPLPHGAVSSLKLSLVVGRGEGARRVALSGRPLTIGSDERCDLRLTDRAVSARHCRLEPGRDGLRVRDLGSRNGTYVDGVVVNLARIGAGSVLRVGRTDLRVVSRDHAAEARVSGVIAASPQMQSVLMMVDRYAARSWSTLITGESGTGKEVIARALHDRGAQPSGPFVAINAGGMSPSLVESELFGHEKGAFTGAASMRRGVFEQADGGTLFLDEIGELPLSLQARLLRVLETWEVRRVGAERTIRVAVRLLCATHRDLPSMVAEGTFRQDLYYRIAQLEIHVPPLRERPSDVSALAAFFLADCAEEVGAKQFEAPALERLAAHHWPGNVRELRNAVRRVAAQCAGATVSVGDVLAVLEDMGATSELDSARLQAVVDNHNGNLAAAARALGIPRTTLRYRLKPRSAGSR